MPANKKRKGKQSDPRTWEEDDVDEAALVNEEEDGAEKIARTRPSLASDHVLTRKLTLKNRIRSYDT